MNFALILFHYKAKKKKKKKKKNLFISKINFIMF